MIERCAWVGNNFKPMEPDVKYHDEEWGVSVHDDKILFEFLILEGAQAVLSWATIPKKLQSSMMPNSRNSCKTGG